MSTLNVTNISDGTNSTSTTNVVQGSAKAWVNFNGTGTVAIRDSFNVASITDNGTGDYTVSFTTAMPDANYCVVTGCQEDHAGRYTTNRAVNPQRSSGDIATGFVRVGAVYWADNSYRDVIGVFVSIFR